MSAGVPNFNGAKRRPDGRLPASPIARVTGVLQCLAAGVISAILALGMPTGAALASNGPWQTTEIDLGAPDLRFQISLPRDARVETTPYAPRAEGAAGRASVAAKITMPGPLPVEATVMVFDLEYPAAAARVCTFEVELVGMEILSTPISADQSAASVRSFGRDDAGLESVGFTRCLTRGQKLLVFHFSSAPAEQATTLAEAGGSLETAAQRALDGITFDDGQPASHWDGMVQLPLRIGQARHTLPVAPDWDIAINDFTGPETAELNLTRHHLGRPAGIVWLGAFPAADGFDIRQDGAAVLEGFIQLQSPDFGTPSLRHHGRVETGPVEMHEFTFDIPIGSAPGAGVFEAVILLDEQRLYAAGWWTPHVEGDARARFMSQLPGQTAYDLVLAAALQLIHG